MWLYCSASSLSYIVSPVTGTAGVGMATAFVVSYGVGQRLQLFQPCAVVVLLRLPEMPEQPQPGAKAMLPIAIIITIAKTSAAEIFFFIIGCSPLTMRLNICACWRSETCKPERWASRLFWMSLSQFMFCSSFQLGAKQFIRFFSLLLTAGRLTRKASATSSIVMF